MELTNKEFRAYFRNVFGLRIRHVDLYRIALTHRSSSENNAVVGKVNNERLEYLGDAMLSAVTADFLFHKYPMQSEGVLTRMRSKLVNRARLNALAVKLGLHDMIKKGCKLNGDSVNGNAFEAVVGAIYLDLGYKKTYDVIINRIFLTHLDMETVYEEDDDYKSRLLIWAQKNKHKVQFNCKSVPDGRGHIYKTVVLLDGEEVSEGLGFAVKKSEQAAAEKALALYDNK